MWLMFLYDNGRQDPLSLVRREFNVVLLKRPLYLYTARSIASTGRGRHMLLFDLDGSWLVSS